MKTRHRGFLALLLVWLALGAASVRADVILTTLPQTNDDIASATLGPLRIKALAFTLPGKRTPWIRSCSDCGSIPSTAR